MGSRLPLYHSNLEAQDDNVGPSTRDLKRQRDGTDGDSESARKRARSSFSGSESITTIPSKLATAPSRPVPLPNPHSKEPIWTIDYNPKAERRLEVNLIRTIKDKQGAFRVKFSWDGQLLAVVADWKQVVSIYNVANGMKTCVLYDRYVSDDHFITHDLSFSSNRRHLATCSGKPGNVIRIWDFAKKHSRNVLKGHLDNVYAVDFSPDGRLLISGSYDSILRIWKMRDGSSRILEDSNGGISCARFSPDGRHVAAGKFDGGVLIWELRSGHVVTTLKGHADIVDCVVFMPNGEGLVSSGGDGTLKYWDLSGRPTPTQASDEKGQGVADDTEQKGCVTLVGHTDRIHSVSISPDGKWIASSSDDRTVRIWSTETGAHHCTLQSAHESNVFSVNFSPAGSYFASADWKGTVQIWSYKDV